MISSYFRRMASGTAILWALFLPLSLEAQEPRSILTFLPTEGRELVLGQEHAGTLTESDPFSTVGILLQAWRYQAQAGETVTIDLLSTDFDAYLYLVGPSLPFPVGDDDGAGGCDARITYTFPSAGEYRVVVSEALISNGGDFVLRVLQDPPAPSDAPCLDLSFESEGVPGDEASFEESDILPADLSSEGRTLSVPGQVEGLLDPDVPGWRGLRGGVLQAWAITLEVNQTVTFDLISDDFDAFLYVTGPGLDFPLWDDDGGEGFNSRLTFTAPASGTFLVVASSFDEERGAYRLSVALD
jgi:hypothetical protein